MVSIIVAARRILCPVTNRNYSKGIHQYVGFCIPAFSANGGRETLKVIIALENLRGLEL